MTRISPPDRLESQPEPSGETRWFKRLSRAAAAIAILLVLIAAAVTLPRFALGSDVARQSVITRLEQMTGEPVTLAGGLTFSLLPRPRLVLNEVRVGGASAITVGQVIADFDATKAMRGTASLSGLVLIEPEVEVGPERPGADAAASLSKLGHDPRKFAKMLLARIDGLRSLEIRDGVVRSPSAMPVGEVSDINLTATQASAGAALSLSGSFVWNGQQTDLTVDLSAIGTLLAGGSSHVDADLSSPAWTASFNGTASLDSNATINGRLRLAAASLRRGIEWLARPEMRVPEVGPLSLDGELLLAGFQANLQDAKISISGSSGEGALEANFAPAVPAVGGTLAFASLDLAPLARAILPLPDDPFDLKRPIDLKFAKAVKLDIRLSAARATLGPVPLTDVAAVITLGGGRAKFDIGDAAVFGGRSQANVVLDANPRTPSATGHFSATGIDTASLLTAMKLEALTMTGRSSLSAELTAPLHDWASIIQNARIETEWVTRDGTIGGFAPRVFATAGTRPLADGRTGTTTSYTSLRAKLASAGSKVRLETLRVVNHAGTLTASGTVSALGGDMAIRGRYDVRSPETASSHETFTTSQPIAFTIHGRWPNPDVTTQ